MIQNCLKDEKVDFFVKYKAKISDNQSFSTTEKFLIFLNYFCDDKRSELQDTFELLLIILTARLHIQTTKTFFSRCFPR